MSWMTLALGAAVAVSLATFVASLLARSGFPLPPEDRRIGRIDGLRGYLALSVMIHHFYLWVQATRLGGTWSEPSVHFLNELGAGSVALFFMTTGFVFYPRVLAGLRATDWPAVYVTRVFRIVPLVALSVVLVTAVLARRTGSVPDRSYPVAAAHWIATWSESPLLGQADSGRVNAYVLWSLWYEWLFYVVLLPVCAAAMDAARRRRLPPWTVPVAFLLAALAAKATGAATGHRIAALPFLPLFAVGMIAFEVRSRPSLRRALSGPRATVAALAALVMAMVATGSPYGASLPLFALFFTCVACGGDWGGVLRARGALVLGECSFGIYLLHGIVLDVLFVDGGRFVATVPTALLPALLPGAVAAVALLTPATYLLVERPAIRAGRRLARAVTQRRVRLDSRELDVAP